MSQLEQLRKVTTVVADSGDFNSYSALKGSIQDGTTNPSVRALGFWLSLFACSASLPSYPMAKVFFIILRVRPVLTFSFVS